MGYQKMIVALGLLVCLSACAAVWNVQKILRKPGQQSLAPPASVWQQYDCAYMRLPFLAIELNQLIPPRLRPGREFNHRLIYAMCTNERADAIMGRLYTRIYFRGRRIVNDVDASYVMRPGRWRVDTFIAPPRDVEGGVYSMELQFVSQHLKFRQNNSFVVEAY
jgi:hypothetical protein